MKDYRKIYESIIQDIDFEDFEETHTNKELDRDPFQTTQQYLRDKQITRLLKQYVKNYEYKSDKNHGYRLALLIYSLILIGILFISVFSIIVLSIVFKYESIALVVGSFIS